VEVAADRACIRFGGDLAPDELGLEGIVAFDRRHGIRLEGKEARVRFSEDGSPVALLVERAVVTMPGR
jgi:hypothetical protein